MNKLYLKTTSFFFIFLLLVSPEGFSQNVGIGTTSPNASAALDISNTSRGLLIPRMTSTGITAIAGPAKGLLVYDSSLNQLKVNMGTAQVPNWQNIAAGSGWNLDGNSGVANSFIGTTDGSPLVFKVSNAMAGYIDSTAKTGITALGFKALNSNTTGPQNSAMGYQALTSNTIGSFNSATGYQSLYSNVSGSFNTAVGIVALHSSITADDNTAIGEGALYANNANANTAVGASALTQNTTGAGNTATGYIALFDNTTGQANAAYGEGALFDNQTGSYNTASGFESLFDNLSGNYNTANGYLSLNGNRTGDYNTAEGGYALFNNYSGGYNTSDGYQSLASNTAGSYNTAVGLNALYGNRGNLASFNTGIGFQALFSTTNSEYNTAVGYNAGYNQDNGYNNVFVGANTDVNGAGYFNVIAIGQGTICTGSSQVTMGNSATGSYRAYANWSNISDGRFKKNIQENVPGLDFITRLRPVTYSLNATGLDDFLHNNSNETAAANARAAGGKENKIPVQPYSAATKAVYNTALKEKETEVVTGFVAQEVESTAKQLGFNFSGIDAPKNSNDVYGLRYAEFVVPLVKAVQEQQQMIADLQKQINELKILLNKK